MGTGISTQSAGGALWAESTRLRSFLSGTPLFSAPRCPHARSAPHPKSCELWHLIFNRECVSQADHAGGEAFDSVACNASEWLPPASAAQATGFLWTWPTSLGHLLALLLAEVPAETEWDAGMHQSSRVACAPRAQH